MPNIVSYARRGPQPNTSQHRHSHTDDNILRRPHSTNIAFRGTRIMSRTQRHLPISTIRIPHRANQDNQLSQRQPKLSLNRRPKVNSINKQVTNRPKSFPKFRNRMIIIATIRPMLQIKQETLSHLTPYKTAITVTRSIMNIMTIAFTHKVQHIQTSHPRHIRRFINISPSRTPQKAPHHQPPIPTRTQPIKAHNNISPRTMGTIDTPRPKIPIHRMPARIGRIMNLQHKRHRLRRGQTTKPVVSPTSYTAHTQKAFRSTNNRIHQSIRSHTRINMPILHPLTMRRRQLRTQSSTTIPCTTQNNPIPENISRMMINIRHALPEYHTMTQ